MLVETLSQPHAAPTELGGACWASCYKSPVPSGFTSDESVVLLICKDLSCYLRGNMPLLPPLAQHLGRPSRLFNTPQGLSFIFSSWGKHPI